MPRNPKQTTVVVRIDIILYVVMVIVAILALASLIMEDVNVAIIGSLLTFSAGVLSGWLAYLHLCSRGGSEDDAPPEDEPHA